MNSSIRFDDSLPAFAALVRDEWGQEAINENFFLRDVTGRLTFIVISEKYPIETRTMLAAKASGIHWTIMLMAMDLPSQLLMND